MFCCRNNFISYERYYTRARKNDVELNLFFYTACPRAGVHEELFYADAREVASGGATSTRLDEAFPTDVYGRFWTERFFEFFLGPCFGFGTDTI